MSTRPLHFGFSYAPYGEPGARFDPFDPAQISALAQSVEKAGFTFIRFQDKQAVGEGAAAFARTEPLTTASFLATRTRRLGFFVTGNTSYFEPFNLARLTASLDHVTHGRAGWELVSGPPIPRRSTTARPNRRPRNTTGVRPRPRRSCASCGTPGRTTPSSATRRPASTSTATRSIRSITPASASASRGRLTSRGRRRASSSWRMRSLRSCPTGSPPPRPKWSSWAPTRSRS